MTLQVSDSFKYKKEEYSLIQVNGKGDLFNPSKYGIYPVPKTSICWRGYECAYEIKDDELVLSQLYVYCRQVVEINGKRPEKEYEDDEETIKFLGIFKIKTKPLRSHFYKDINLKLNFTGEILLGTGFVESDFDYYYERQTGVIGIHSYKQVLVLRIENGKLISEEDISEKVDELREQLRLEYKDKDIYDWYEDEESDSIEKIKFIQFRNGSVFIDE